MLHATTHQPLTVEQLAGASLGGNMPLFSGHAIDRTEESAVRPESIRRAAEDVLHRPASSAAHLKMMERARHECARPPWSDVRAS